MGYAVTCHPEADGTSRRPDFLAEKGGGAVYVEARSASPSDVVVGADARVDALCESLDKPTARTSFCGSTWRGREAACFRPARCAPRLSG